MLKKIIFKYFTSMLIMILGLINLPAYSKSVTPNAKTRNVILFIGDGMQKEHEIAASRYLTGIDNGLIWNQFHYKTYVSTWNVDSYNRYAYSLQKPAFSYEKFDPLIGYNPTLGGDKPYPETTKIDDNYFLKPLLRNKEDKSAKVPATDSAASATAIATGIKTETGNISWLPGDEDGAKIRTIAEIVREKNGASIGVVTTVPFNHATPAAFVSHNVDRNNYYTGKKGYKSLGIAEEIIKVTKPDVVIGGGNPNFDRKGYLNKKLYKELLLSDDYIISERLNGENGAIGLLNTSNTAFEHDKKLFGLYGGKNGNFESPIPAHSPDSPIVKRATLENPSLAESTVAALNVLGKNHKGFFLMVEQGDIDWANHYNDYKSMIGCVWDLNEAVKAAINFIDKPGDDIDWNNTLIIVTADHANSYMRLNNAKKLCKVCLPKQRRYLGFIGKWVYPGKEVKYSLGNHTNELVSLYAKGSGSNLFKNYEGIWYPKTRIIDNTHIFQVIGKSLGLSDIDSDLFSNKK
ncbi:MAG: hypothetical protein A2255_04515 [Candidatus Melainabacteria bacterium RIFOXYA2_FULL_32_9]|nr:MAG: hypothetical protein A2255_04515 [Candidatus Melainabacteria bacterium RIFOXYA2_FULL_32_9]